MEDKPISEQESLQLITEMIEKAKHSFHESGSSAILWGTVIAVCGLVNFTEMEWGFSIGFDVWLLALVAVIPQVIISIRESRQRKVLTHNEAVINQVWMVYAISIFALVFYLNIVPTVTNNLLKLQAISITQQEPTERVPFYYFIASANSLFLILYAIPTLITGLTYRFKPMLIGAVFCYVFFALSLFTTTKWDMLFSGLAAIGNWLIPGLLLRRRFYAQNRIGDV